MLTQASGNTGKDYNYTIGVQNQKLVPIITLIPRCLGL